MIEQTTTEAAISAHARLLRDPSIQFAFDAPKPPAPPPTWLVALLRAIGGVLQAMGPWVSYALWGLLGLGVLAVVAIVLREMLFRGRRPSDVGVTDLQGADTWRPSAAKAQALLKDADRLSAEGRFTEAVHVLLHRSIADVAGRRPDLIAPSLTSRDIAGLPQIPPAPRQAFTQIAQTVEAAVFGHRPVDEPSWLACREAYVRFAFPDAWTAPA